MPGDADAHSGAGFYLRTPAIGARAIGPQIAHITWKSMRTATKIARQRADCDLIIDWWQTREPPVVILFGAAMDVGCRKRTLEKRREPGVAFDDAMRSHREQIAQA